MSSPLAAAVPVVAARNPILIASPLATSSSPPGGAHATARTPITSTANRLERTLRIILRLLARPFSLLAHFCSLDLSVWGLTPADDTSRGAVPGVVSTPPVSVAGR